MTLTEWTEAAREYGAYVLANMAQCDSPDTRGSGGATMLEVVCVGVIEAVEYGRILPGDVDGINAGSDRSDVAHEIADGAVPHGTYQAWQAFAELGAFREDITELGGELTSGSDLTQEVAQVALYMIAERLAYALMEDLDGNVETDDDDAEDTAHDWQAAPLTGTVTCARCGLLPLDDDDIELECTPEVSE